MADAAGGVPFADLFRALPLATRRRLVRRHGEDRVLAAMMGPGSLRAAQRPPPGAWGIWVILAGRGFGKTHAGAEWVHGAAAAGGKRIALVAPTLDVARALMVEGESGLLARLPPGQQLHWQPTAKRLVWGNGSEARLYSGAEPNALRGGQFDYAWGDEFAHWAGGEDTLMNLRIGEEYRLRATGAGDVNAASMEAVIGGAAIQPLAPVHLRWRRSAGMLSFNWIAQSRVGFGWSDLADVPIGEARLAFRVVLRDAAGPVAEAEVSAPSWSVPDRAGPLWLDVAQLGATLGSFATLSIS